MRSFVVLVLILLCSTADAQELVGTWRISSLPAGTQITEYTLYPASPEPGRNYGNHILLSKDGTFTASYSAPCGNDCFTSTSGKYELVDDQHVRFFLEHIRQHGDCHTNSDPNIDLGLFYIRKDMEKGSIQLLKSDGNTEQDKLNLYYKNWVFSIEKEYNQYEYLLDWEWLNRERKPAYTKEELVAVAMAKHNISTYEIVHSQPGTDYRFTIVLVKTANEIRAVFYTNGGGLQVTLFDDSYVKKIDQWVAEINAQPKLKQQTFDPMDAGKNNTHNTLAFFKKRKQIQKMVYLEDYGKARGGIVRSTVYFQGDTPLYIEVEKNPDPNQNENITRLGFYPRDLKAHKVTIKEIEEKGGKVSIADRVMEKFTFLLDLYEQYKEER